MKYDIDRRDRRSLANKIIDEKGNARLQAKSGDMKITRDVNGVKLNVKYGTKWYSTILRSDAEVVETNFKESSLTYKEHYLYDGVHAKDTWLNIDFALDRTRVLPALVTGAVIWLIPQTMNLKGVKLMSNTAFNGDLGIRLLRYNKGGADMSLIGSYTPAFSLVRDMTFVRGNDYFFPLSGNLKRGESYIAQVYGPTINCFSMMKMQWILENKLSIK